jgi:hypothetical protein
LYLLSATTDNFDFGIRKIRYRKYWHVIDNLGGQKKASYMSKKARTASEDGESVWHGREIMPEYWYTIHRT